MRALILFLFINLNAFSQEKTSSDILVMGNFSSVCFSDSTYHKANALPKNLDSFQVILLFSSSTSQLSEIDIERLTDFIENGGGLYAGAENWPFQSESNQITRRLYKKESYGDFSDKNAEKEYTGNLQLAEIDTIPAGTTTVAFPMDYRLKVEAWIEDQPLILTGEMGAGRIIIDGGYSRFYCDSRTPESDVILMKFLVYLYGKKD